MEAHRPFMRPPAPSPPPPPPSVDPQYHQYHPPGPPQGPWYPNQFHSPSAPPPPSWAPPPPPPPPSDHVQPPGYPPPPYPYPPHYPRPYMPPPPQHLNPYPPQDWSNPNWGYQQGWNHQVQNNTEDWAAKAKAWASAKAAMEAQCPQTHYQNQYSQAVEPPQHPLSGTSPSVQPVHFQGNPSTGTGPASYPSDSHVPFSSKDNGDSNAVFHPQVHPVADQSAHQQEVPSSYSSVSGKHEQSENLLHLPSSAAQGGMGHLQAPMTAANESGFPCHNQYTGPSTNPADQPLEFASKFNRDQDLLAQSVYAHHDTSGPLRGIDPVVPMTSVNTWNSSMTSDVAYPSFPTVLPSGSQHDPSIPIPPPVPGHGPGSFPRISGPSFHPTIHPPSRPFGPGAGSPLPQTGGFPADSYGLPGSGERPKKAPVPTWLREEIIKSKGSIASSSLGHPTVEAQFIEEDSVDKSFEKSDQADSKSIDSSRSTEEEDDDEDYVEAARTAAINQEIKRILTEVLLKVTDQLFDEIATKVLNEDDEAEGNDKTLDSDRMVSPTSRAKASARTIVSMESKGLESEDGNETSNSSAGGNILGLANYASDDEDEETQVPKLSAVASAIKPERKITSHDETEKGRQVVVVEEQSQENPNNGGSSKLNLPVELSSSPTISPKHSHINLLNGKMDDTSASVSKEAPEEKVGRKSKLLDDEVDMRKSAEADTRDVKIGVEPVLTDRDGHKKTSGKDSSWGCESDDVMVTEKLDVIHRSKDERHIRKGNTERNESEETKDPGKHGKKMKESVGKRPSNFDTGEDKKDRGRPHRDSGRDENRRIERSRDKDEDRSHQKASRDSSRHKKRRSSSPSSRDQNSRDSFPTRGKDSTDDDSDYSRRKSQTRKRNLSPSPSSVRSRRRHSRSPHSKHSQRRHSPYSSLESSRERRSRSRSPVRRHR